MVEPCERCPEHTVPLTILSSLSKWHLLSASIIMLLLVGVTSSGTVLAGSSTVKIVFVGDIGNSTSGKATINAIKTEHPDLAVLLGDLGYSPSADTFAKEINSLKANGVSVIRNIGNHDSDEEEKDSVEKAYWSLCSPGHGFWKVAIGPLTIIGLNTQCDGSKSHSADKCSATTISKYLKTLKADNKFMLTTSHKSLCESPKSKHTAYPCTKAMKGEFKRLGIDADIGAHNHCMASDGKGNFVSGAGGRSHYSCSGWKYTNSKDFGYLVLEGFPDQLAFTFKGTDGTVIQKTSIP